MARISSFNSPEAIAIRDCANELMEGESEEMKLLRAMADSEDVRILIGDVFMRIAASAPENNRTPYSSLLQKLICNHDEQCDISLRLFMSKLDRLRAYELMKQRLVKRRDGDQGNAD